MTISPLRIAVTGNRGQVGWELMRRGGSAGHLMIGADLPDLDICKVSNVSEWMRASVPDIVINAAAYTAVDAAESDADTAYAVNVEGPLNLAAACGEMGIPLIHLSTDYVFDGSASRPYRETDPVCPESVYGRTKAQGEAAVRKILSRHIIVRTAWVYGVHGKNFVKTMVNLARDRFEVRVVDDQAGSPTFAGDLAEALLAIAQTVCSVSEDSAYWGTYHFCGQGAVSWHGFAVETFRQVRNRIPLKLTSCHPISTADYPTPASRPQYSVLDTRKIIDTFGVEVRPWTDSLCEMLSELF